MSIPLVQKAEKDDINTSIIAIKRNIERINMLLGLSNSEDVDTSEFVKKSDIVDEVTVGNMQSVTSNAVAKAIGGSQIKTYQFTLQINSSSGYGYISQNNMPSEIVADGDNCNVLNCFFWWGAISDSRGLQVNLVNINNGTAFFIYYKPTTMADNVNVRGKIYYIV
jgi:hypothetical protein